MSGITGKKISFIGGGKMAEAIFSGILSAGLAAPQDICISDIREARLSELHEKYGVDTILGAADNNGSRMLLQKADIIVLALEPQAAKSLLTDIKDCLNCQTHLVLSIMGGVTLDYLEGFIVEAPVIRIMPNTPMLVKEGVAGISLGKNANQQHGEIACEIFNAVGISYVLPEHLIDPLTGISGCGPAFAGIFMQALADGGVQMGLPRAVATKLAAQMLVGTGRMVLETGIHPEILKDNVCTPGGGTIAGVRALEAGGFRGVVMSAVENSMKRMQEVGKNV